MGAVRRVLAAAAVLTGAGVGRALWGLPKAMGASRRTVQPWVAGSPHHRDGDFHNSLPATVLAPGGIGRLLRRWIVQGRPQGPSAAVPVVATSLPADAAGLAATWFGHSSVLLEVDGARVLADPVWGHRVSPSPVFGPTRLHPVPVALDALPAVDAVLISHDHYDHLDLPTVRVLLATQTAPFVVPLGVGAHLRRWGVPEGRIVELDWDGTHAVGELTLTCTEARHFSGRGLGNNPTQWASWVVAGPRHRVFYGGDTGYTPAFTEIGQRHGPFDLTVLPVGAYNEQWPDIHLDPEQAVRAHRELNPGAAAGALLPVHWGTFTLAFHPWDEPVTRLLAAADGLAVLVPRPGERVDLAALPPLVDWWSAVA